MIVTAVEYLNTLPMVSGIRSVANSLAINFELRLCTPAVCAKMAVEGVGDVALVPVGALPQLPDCQIITDYCISATGVVDTVLLLSNTPIEGVRKIYLDTESRTSVLLCRILCAELWGISPELVEGFSSRELEQGEAIVAIGDKVFEMESGFTHKIDLSAEWGRLTGLPFVFAVWVAISERGKVAEGELNRALCHGVQNIEKWLPRDPNRPRNLHYLTQRIEYELTTQKRQAITLFLNKIKTLDAK